MNTLARFSLRYEGMDQDGNGTLDFVAADRVVSVMLARAMAHSQRGSTTQALPMPLRSVTWTAMADWTS